MFKRILKKHVGRTCEILGCNRAEGVPQHGKIEEVRNGIATVRVHVVEEIDGHRDHSQEGYTFRTPCASASSRVVEIW